MRAVLLVLILAVLAIIVALATGFVDVNQIRGARAPKVVTTDNGVVAQGGHAPAFDVETGSVRVGAEETTVKVPTIEVQPPGNRAAPANNAM